MTADQEESWAGNAELCAEDLEPVSCRASAELLLEELATEWGSAAITALLQAAAGAIATARSAGGASSWKLREAALQALGTSAENILEVGGWAGNRSCIGELFDCGEMSLASHGNMICKLQVAHGRCCWLSEGVFVVDANSLAKVTAVAIDTAVTFAVSIATAVDTAVAIISMRQMAMLLAFPTSSRAPLA